MKKALLTVISILTCGLAAAQNADEMLSELIGTVEDEGISCETVMTMNNENRDISLIMKGEQFFMQTPETAVWFDGKNTWFGVIEDGKIIEVTVQDGTVEDHISDNPFLMLKYHEGFTVSASDSKTLVLTAEDRQKGIYMGVVRIVVHLTDDGRPTLITMRQKDMSSDIRLKIVSYETGKTKESDFTFPKAKWPDAEIIDLRD